MITEPNFAAITDAVEAAIEKHTQLWLQQTHQIATVYVSQGMIFTDVATAADLRKKYPNETNIIGNLAFPTPRLW